MKKITTLLCLAFLFSLVACNTVQGVGKDVQKAGNAIEKSVK